MEGQTPDTLAYLLLGLAVIFGVTFLYVASLLLRRSNLKRDIEMLEHLEQDE